MPVAAAHTAQVVNVAAARSAIANLFTLLIITYARVNVKIFKSLLINKKSYARAYCRMQIFSFFS